MKSQVIFYLALVLSGGLFGCSTAPKIHERSNATEWFPTLGEPESLDNFSRQQILQKCGVKAAEKIWIRTVDLNQDGKEDCIVAIELPEEKGAHSTGFRSLTYVFRGGNVGAFGLQWENATLWFSLVTYEGLYNVRIGDEETVRQFSLLQQDGKWLVRCEEHVYGNDGGEASARLMNPIHSATWVLPPSQIPPANPNYP